MLLRVPATSANLGPGFDCIGMALDLYNYIDFEINSIPGFFSIEISGEGQNDLSKDESNLVYQSFIRAFEKRNEPVPGICLKLINNIPLARGLGSSSAAIIGGLLAANAILANKLSNLEILELALEFEGHPDNIAPALLGGIVLCTANDNGVHYHKMSPPEELHCSVLIPDFELTTKKARDILPEFVPLKDAVYNVGKMGLFINAINTGDLELLKDAIDDKIHQPYRSSLIPGLKDLFIQVKDTKILGIAISGAGPSIIVFHRKEDKDEVVLLQKILAEKGTISRLFNLKPQAEGAQLV